MHDLRLQFIYYCRPLKIHEVQAKKGTVSKKSRQEQDDHNIL